MEEEGPVDQRVRIWTRRRSASESTNPTHADRGGPRKTRKASCCFDDPLSTQLFYACVHGHGDSRGACRNLIRDNIISTWSIRSLISRWSVSGTATRRAAGRRIHAQFSNDDSSSRNNASTFDLSVIVQSFSPCSQRPAVGMGNSAISHYARMSGPKKCIVSSQKVYG